MQPNYFEIAKSLQLAHGQATLDRLKKAEESSGAAMTKCVHCGEYFPSGGDENGIFCMCSELCAEAYEAEELAWED